MKIHALLALTFAIASLHAEPLPPLGKTTPIFDGKTLDGWESPTPALWKIEDGCLTGGDGTTRIPFNDFLCTKASFSNFILRLKIKLTGDAKTGLINSGVQIRTSRIPGKTEVAGYQCDYGDPEWWAAIYDEGRRNKLMAKTDMAAINPVLKRDDWNEYVIRAEGPRIQTWINGAQGVDYTEADANIAQDGIIGFQVHGGGNTKVQVKDVTIETLAPTPGAPLWDKVGRPGDKKAAAGKDSDARENAGSGAKPMKAGNAANAGGAKTPQEELATFKVPDGFEVELVAAESEGVGKFVPLAFDQRGALWTTTAFEYPVDGNENPAAADALYASKAKDKVLIFDRDPNSPTGLASKPRVFMDGLAIPLGVLPYKNGCYVLHGHDIVFAEDTDGDGKADKTTVILTGFGVQDSHLFPHQFTRAPGGWIWMAQGAFNYSKVSRPGDEKNAVKFDQTRMAKFRPDGSEFTITSNGPCNIWGLVLNGEGEAFIQEANDFGYPVMPFHEYANYPGCSDGQWKSYAPEFPGTAPDFRMGGTGLSGLALLDEGWVKLLGAGDSRKSEVGSKKLEVVSSQKDGERGSSLTTDNFSLPTSSQTVLVANPITNRVQRIQMHRDGPRWKLDKPTDFITSSDEWFRPVAITIGPDGCLYIVDWYNKIISHNEVPRNHPDRDKTRGRIWRVKATAQKPFPMQDFTKATGDELLAKLGGPSLAQSHLAWQAIEDRGLEIGRELESVLLDKTASAARRIQALWALEGLPGGIVLWHALLLDDPNRNVRREAVRCFASLASTRSIEKRLSGGGFDVMPTQQRVTSLTEDPDPEVRSAVIKAFGRFVDEMSPRPFSPLQADDEIGVMMRLAREPLAEPLAPATRNGKPIKVREAYEREFERYLVRMFLERHPDAVAKFLDSPDAQKLPVEARLLASLALEPKASASRVAQLLPKLTRPPGQEEVLRLVQFLDEPGVGDAVKATLANPATSATVLESLLAVRTKLDATKITPLLSETAQSLLAKPDPASLDLGVKLAGAFKLTSTEPALIALLEKGARAPALPILSALGEIGSTNTALFASLATTAPDPAVRDAALSALSASRAADAPSQVLALYPKLTAAQRHVALDKLSATKPGAAAIVTALTDGTIKPADLDAPTFDRLQTVLGPNDAALAKLTDQLGALFRPVLTLNGKDDAFAETNLVIEGAFTVETWVRLAPGIGNADGILFAKDAIDLNFYDAKFRVYAGPAIHDAIVSTKPIAPDLWTHVAATRNAAGRWKIYINGELDTADSKPAPQKIVNPQIGATGAAGGTEGALAEYRIWNRERTADEIRNNFDRSFQGQPKPEGLVLYATGADGWGKLGAGARIAKTSDFPPVLTADEAKVLDAKFAKFRELAAHPGDAAKGKATAAICQACHLMGTTGGNIGPNLSGVGSINTEALLRNIITPNAAMENGYRTYRVEMKSGDLIEAFFVSEDKNAVVVRLPGAADRRIAKSEIARTQYLRRSLMPEGILDALPPEQVSDLFAFLKTLK